MPPAPTPLGQVINTDPVLAIVGAQVVARGGYFKADDPKYMRVKYGNEIKAVLQTITSGGLEAEGLLKQIAQTAWYRQTKGQQGAPEQAPADYIASWMGAWKSGRLVQNGPSLDLALATNGFTPPAVKSLLNVPPKPADAVNGNVRDQAHAFAIGQVASAGQAQRLAQGDRAQYSSDAEYQKWFAYACGAASFASLFKAATGKDMTVGQAVGELSKRELINTTDGLLRGSDFTDIAKTLNEVAGADVAMGVNLRTPGAVQAHFKSGGGAIMVTGPSRAVWGVAHIYVITGADEQGVTIVDSSRAAKDRLTWDQYMSQTGIPGAGAGAALKTAGAGPAYAQHSAAVSAPVVAGQRAIKEGPQQPASGGGAWDEPTVRAAQQQIVAGAPEPRITPDMSIEQRMQAWKPTLDWVEQNTGLNQDIVAGLLMAENGFGNSNLSRNHNNWFSMEYNAQYDKFASGSADGRFASYPTAKHALARFIGVLSHPENTYNTRGALWAQRGDPEAVIQNLIKGGYIVEEPGFPISTWVNNLRNGMATYRRAVGR